MEQNSFFDWVPWGLFFLIDKHQDCYYKMIIYYGRQTFCSTQYFTTYTLKYTWCGELTTSIHAPRLELLGYIFLNEALGLKYAVPHKKTLSKTFIKSISAKLQAFHPQKYLSRARSNVLRGYEVILINVGKSRHVQTTTWICKPQMEKKISACKTLLHLHTFLILDLASI